LDRLQRALADQGMYATALLAAVRDAVWRAESAPGRATEDLARARQAEARAEGTAARRSAAQDRAAVAKTLADTQDPEEVSWLLDRRDFVAAERGDEERASAAVLAAYLTIAVASFMRRSTDERREASLHRALSTRNVIGQAKGILMERLDLSAADAFEILRASSQRLNVRLADVAEELTRTGSLPGTDGGPDQVCG
jgi:hypothetical protein